MAGRRLRLPSWVTLPQAVVEVVEHTTLEWAGRTKAPAALWAWTALQWVGAVDGTGAPVTDVSCAATLSRAVAEFDMGLAIMQREPLPSVEWFVERGVDPAEIPSRQWWDTCATCSYGWEVGRGTAAALAWLLRFEPDPTQLVPHLHADGSPIPDETRAEWSALLARRVRTAEPGAYFGPGGPIDPQDLPLLETVRPTGAYPSASPKSSPASSRESSPR